MTYLVLDRGQVVMEVLKKKKLLCNQRGMTLVNVLMAAGIGAIILSGITAMITDVFKSQRSIQSKDAQRELNSSIRQLLSDPLICTASFGAISGGGDPTGAGFTVTKIVDTAIPPNIKYQTGVNYLNNLVTITGFEVKNFSADNVAVNPKLGKVELAIKMNKIGSTVGSVQMTTIILLQTTLDASNKINSCHALGVADSLWQISPTNMADIYYQAGNVGIGTSNPQKPLHVADGGDGTQIQFGSKGFLSSYSGGAYLSGAATMDSSGIWTAQAGGAAIVIAEPTKGFQFLTDSGLTTGNTFNPTERMRITTSGNVGIGTLTPGAKLQVTGAPHSPPATSGATQVGVNLRLKNSDSAGVLDIGGDSSNGMWLQAGYDADLSDHSYPLLLNPYGGNVGIGTTTPGMPLDVVGNIKLNSTNVLSRVGLFFTDPNGSAYILSGGGHYNGLGFYTNSTYVAGPVDAKMVILDNGNVGIGSSTPGYKFDVSGDINTSTVLRIAGTQICSSGGCTSSSDRKLKENIKPLANALDNILKLQGVGYDWKDKQKFSDKHQVGLIAQDLEKVYPEVVITDPISGLKSVAYDHLIAPVIEALKELNKRIAELFKASDVLSKELASVKARADKAEKENVAIKAYLCAKDPNVSICK